MVEYLNSIFILLISGFSVGSFLYFLKVTTGAAKKFLAAEKTYKEQLVEAEERVKAFREDFNYSIQELSTKIEMVQEFAFSLSKKISEFEDTQSAEPADSEDSLEHVITDLAEQVNQLIEEVEQNLNIEEFKEMKSQIKKLNPMLIAIRSQMVSQEQIKGLDEKIDAIGRFLSEVEVVSEDSESQASALAGLDDFEWEDEEEEEE